MKRWLTLGVAALAVCPAAAPAQGNFLEDIAAKYANAVAVVQYTLAIETGDRIVSGEAICISSANGLGVFLTAALDPQMQTSQLKDFQLVCPGPEGKTIKAKLLGVDAWTGLGFVQSLEKHDWQVVQFSASSRLKLGQQVGSIGVLVADPAHPVCVGTAYVGAMLRVPGDLVYVTGGRLTGACSPVFTSDGRAVGIVGQQLFLGYQTPTRQGMAGLQLRSGQEAAFFTPVEEFVHVLKSIPSDGQASRLAWIGVNKFEAVTPEVADALKLTQPAIKVDEVIPNEPAAKAGLGNRDIVVELNGQPIEKLATPQLTVQNFVRLLTRMPEGTKVALKVLTGAKPREVAITLGRMPKRPAEAERYFNRALGLLVREKVPLDEYLGKSETARVPGLLVMGVVKDSPSADAGLRGDDLITNVNNQPVKTREVFAQIVEKSLAANPKAAINFLVRRGPDAQVIVVKPAE